MAEQEKMKRDDAIALLAATIMTRWRDHGRAPATYGIFADMAAEVAYEFFAPSRASAE